MVNFMCIAAMEGGRNEGERRERGGTVKRRRLSDSPIGMDHLLRVRGVTNSKEGEYGIKPPHPLRTSGRESKSSDLNFSRKTTSKFFTSFAESSVR